MSSGRSSDNPEGNAPASIEVESEIDLGGYSADPGKASKPLNPEDYPASCVEQLWAQRYHWMDHIRFYQREFTIIYGLALLGIAIIVVSFYLPLNQLGGSFLRSSGVLFLDAAGVYMYLYTLEGPPFFGTKNGNPVCPAYLVPSPIPVSDSPVISSGFQSVSTPPEATEPPIPE